MGLWLSDLFDVGELERMEREGYVTRRRHPDLPLSILNYTPRAQYERVWNPVTRACRGLIVADDHVVVAQPFPKFFNHDEPDAVFDPALPCRVTDKLDGSLGIVYPTPGGPAVATRGSFVSVQAAHATALLRARYPQWRPEPDHTYLVEIIYPGNRIVVDYGDRDELVLLAILDDHTGRSVPDPGARWWPGPRVETFPYRSLAEALAAPPRPGAEGLVVEFADGARVKIKQADYVSLHKVLTGFTAREVWKRCAVAAAVEAGLPRARIAQGLKLDADEVAGIVAAGPDWLDKINAALPEEFVDWVRITADRLADEAGDIQAMAVGEALALRDFTRREAAASLADHPYRWQVFLAMDGNPALVTSAWYAVYPEHELPFRTEGD